MARTTVGLKCGHCGCEQFVAFDEDGPNARIECTGCGASGRYSVVEERIEAEAAKLMRDALTTGYDTLERRFGSKREQRLPIEITFDRSPRRKIT